MHSKQTLLKIDEVAQRTRLAKPTIYKLIRQGAFPQQLRLSTNTVAWLESEVDAWIQARVQARAGQ